MESRPVPVPQVAADGPRPDFSVVDAAIRTTAEAVRRDHVELGLEAAQHIFDLISDFAENGVEAVVLEMCRANTSIIVDYLARGVPLTSVAPTEEVVRLTRDLVRSGVSLAAITRAYSLGIKYLIDVWASAVKRHLPRDSVALEVAHAGTAFLMSWMDVVTAQSADEYRVEAERLARERSLARVEDVRRVLVDDDVQLATSSSRLGYRLSGRHVALVLRDQSPRPDGTAPDRAIHEIMASARLGRGLAVRVDLRTTWWWLPAPSTESWRPDPSSQPVQIAVGRAGSGLDGFRRSHQDALAALRVAELAGRGAAEVTHYDDVDIVAMCSTDPACAVAFVVAELGNLLGDDPADARLRKTLVAFYAAGSNFRGAGEALGVHHNTVRYRIEQAEARLGRPVGERRLATELALHLAAVLMPPGVGRS